jgi:hypothetical protein
MAGIHAEGSIDSVNSVQIAGMHSFREMSTSLFIRYNSWIYWNFSSLFIYFNSRDLNSLLPKERYSKMATSIWSVHSTKPVFGSAYLVDSLPSGLRTTFTINLVDLVLVLGFKVRTLKHKKCFLNALYCTAHLIIRSIIPTEPKFFFMCSLREDAHNKSVFFLVAWTTKPLV